LKNKLLFKRGLAIAFIVAVLDLFSKRVIFGILDTVDNNEIVVFSFFNLTKVLNTGVSFGMFNDIANSQVILSALQIIIALILCFWLYNNKDRHVNFALGLIIGGAFGNAIDRIKNGAVADFLDFHIGSYHYPAFNLADSAIFIGVVILLFFDFIFKKR